MGHPPPPNQPPTHPNVLTYVPSPVISQLAGPVSDRCVCSQKTWTEAAAAEFPYSVSRVSVPNLLSAKCYPPPPLLHPPPLPLLVYRLWVRQPR